MKISIYALSMHIVLTQLCSYYKVCQFIFHDFLTVSQQRFLQHILSIIINLPTRFGKSLHLTCSSSSANMSQNIPGSPDKQWILQSLLHIIHPFYNDSWKVLPPVQLYSHYICELGNTIYCSLTAPINFVLQPCLQNLKISSARTHLNYAVQSFSCWCPRIWHSFAFNYCCS